MIRKQPFAALAAACALALAAGAASEADARTRTRNVTITGQNGAQRTIQDQRTRTQGARTHDRTTTYRDGSSRSVNSQAERTGDNTFSANRTVTGRNGQTRSQSGDFSVNRTDSGRTIQGEIATSNHGQVDYSREVSRNDGVRSVSSQATFEDGTSISRASQGGCADGVCGASGTVTGRGGGVTAWEQTRTRTETGATFARDTTFPDGTTRSVEAERVGNGDGTGAINRTVTGRNGQTRTQTGTYEVERSSTP